MAHEVSTSIRCSACDGSGKDEKKAKENGILAFVSGGAGFFFPPVWVLTAMALFASTKCQRCGGSGMVTHSVTTVRQKGWFG